MRLSERFWARVRRAGPDECWIWLGPRTPQGYGLFSFRSLGRWGVGAHRYAYLLVHERIPRGAIVRHVCGERLCVNPEHLRAGTYLDNYKDGVRHGTLTPRKQLDRKTARAAINDLARGTPSSHVARKYGLSTSIVFRMRYHPERYL